MHRILDVGQAVKMMSNNHVQELLQISQTSNTNAEF